MIAASSGGRVGWVDFAKGFCIIFVVMMHSTLGVEAAAGAQGWMHFAVQFAKPFRMPDFFLISGLFLALVIDRPWLRYIDRKVVHFLYFYLLWMTIQFAIKAPAWMGEGQTPPEIARLYLLSFVDPFGTLWFIYILPLFFIVTRLLKNVPWQMTLAAAALLEILPVHTGWLIPDEFAGRYVYFLAGYLFAANIFALADWARANVGKALALLCAWFAVNGFATFTAVDMPLWAQAIPGPHFASDLPVVSLLLGAAGGIAVVVLTSLLSLVPAMRFLGYLGRNSIVVYLAFFLPMAVSRGVLLKFAPMLDIGTVSLLVTVAGVCGPVVLYWIIQRTGIGRFLFERPAWARIETAPAAAGGKVGLSPAE
ncbi:MAG: acyltransferase family protein [Nitratireductor sp.]|nr:acyltransferase family protein [Nitratireductor sp.]